MALIVELIFTLFGELIFQIIIELLLEFGFQSLAETVSSRKERNPYLAFFGYCILGVIIGSISLLILPTLLLVGKTIAVINLIVTPIIAGIVMALMGKWRNRRGKELIRLDSFLYGFAFAFSLALTRFIFGEIGA